MNKIKEIAFVVMNIAIPLAFGGLFYCAFAPDVILVKWVSSHLGSHTIRSNIVDTPVLLFMRNHLLDMLWSYSLVFAIQLIIGGKKKSVLSITVLVTLLGTTLELLQFTGVILGTSDVLDVVFEAVAAAIAGLIIIRRGTYEKIH